MRTFFTFLGLTIAGLLIGGGYAVLSLNQTVQSGSVQQKNGCWKYNAVMDLSANQWQRALIARIGLFALRESEVLYFIADEDSNGDPLSADKQYVLDGVEPDTRYWSYTIYGKDRFLIPNETKRFSFNMDDMTYQPIDSNQLEYQARRSYQIAIGPTNEGQENWLPSGKSGQVYILLRMYNPSPNVYNHLDKVTLPTITPKS